MKYLLLTLIVASTAYSHNAEEIQAAIEQCWAEQPQADADNLGACVAQKLETE